MMDERAERWERRFEWPMVIAALLVIPLLVIEESDLGEPWETVGVILNWGTWLAFAVEAAVMIWVTPKPLDWLKRNPIDAAIVILTPPFLPANLAAARLFRLLRLLRLVPIFRLRNLLSLDGLRNVAFLAFVLVLVGGAVYAEIENEHSTSDGIWWALVTITTVGYGDSVPTTEGGRVIAAVVMLVGIGFVALLTAFLAERFVRRGDDRVDAFEEKTLRELRGLHERLDQLERALKRRP